MDRNDSQYILIVTGDTENQKDIENILKREYQDVITTTLGPEILEFTQTYPVALILLELSEDETDIFTTVRLFRENENTKDVPIIFILPTFDLKQRIFKNRVGGVVDYLFKPLDIDILKNKVALFMSLQKQKSDLLNKNYQLEQANKLILEQQKTAIEEERLKVLLQMAGATAHELNQPLMILLGNIELMELSFDVPEDMSILLAKIKESAKRISDTVQKIQTLRHHDVKQHDKQSKMINLDQKVHVLCIENNNSDYKIIKDLVKHQKNLRMSRSKNIKASFNALEKEHFDIIIMEYYLPDGTGFDFLLELKTKHLDIPAAILTSEGDEIVASKMIQAGAYEYLPKDKLTRSSILRVINQTIEKANLKRDLTRAHARLAAMATNDELTNLYNRRYFDDALENEFARAKRYEPEVSLMLVDIDHFKEINELYGHPVGDMVLEELGKLFNSIKRNGDLVCRFGGEEFAIITPNTKLDAAQKASERYQQEIQNHVFSYGNSKLSITASIGIASSSSASSAKELLNQAGQAVLQAKNKGRNQIVIYKN